MLLIVYAPIMVFSKGVAEVYFLIFLLVNPAIPTRPVPKSNIVVGSGTGFV